jgi:hypothetical protein
VASKMVVGVPWCLVGDRVARKKFKRSQAHIPAAVPHPPTGTANGVLISVGA